MIVQWQPLQAGIGFRLTASGTCRTKQAYHSQPRLTLSAKRERAAQPAASLVIPLSVTSLNLAAGRIIACLAGSFIKDDRSTRQSRREQRLVPE